MIDHRRVAPGGCKTRPVAATEKTLARSRDGAPGGPGIASRDRVHLRSIEARVSKSLAICTTPSPLLRVQTARAVRWHS